MADETTTEISPGYPRKRARTRRALLVAGMAALAERGPDGATVGDVARRARVSSGTFYNHFHSLEDLVAAVIDELAGGVEIAADVLSGIDDDPAIRVAIGTSQLLRLTDQDRDAAQAFVALLASVPELRRRVRRTVTGAVADGIRAGRFHRSSAGPTADALLGAVVWWMRTRLADDAGEHDERELLGIALAVVGLSPDEVAATIDAALSTSA